MKIWILCVAVFGLLGLADAAYASPPSYFPSYLLLRPSGDSHRASRHYAYPAYGIPVQCPAIPTAISEPNPAVTARSIAATTTITSKLRPAKVPTASTS